MQTDHLARLKAWFASYTRSFLTGERPIDSPLELKIEHTARVCDNICLLGRSVDLTDGQLCLAETIADKRMARFQDMKSLNDFKLLQLSWVFDLHFPETLTQAKKRGDLAAIARSLPDHRILRHAIGVISDRLDDAVSVGPDPGNGFSKMAGNG
jgi:hypothetical protein